MRPTRPPKPRRPGLLGLGPFWGPKKGAHDDLSCVLPDSVCEKQQQQTKINISNNFETQSTGTHPTSPNLKSTQPSLTPKPKPKPQHKEIEHSAYFWKQVQLTNKNSSLVRDNIIFFETLNANTFSRVYYNKVKTLEPENNVVKDTVSVTLPPTQNTTHTHKYHKHTLLKHKTQTNTTHTTQNTTTGIYTTKYKISNIHKYNRQINNQNKVLKNKNTKKTKPTPVYNS